MNPLLIEASGTYALVASVLFSNGNAFVISFTLLAIILVGASAPPGADAHYNPAIYFAMFLNKKISMNTMIMYLSAQLIGGSLAYLTYQNIKLLKLK